MIHFAYPNVKTTSGRFIGCGRYIASEHKPEGYEIPSKIIDNEKPENAAQILAYESFQTNKIICEKRDRPEYAYQGNSLHLSYLLALISRSRKVKLNIDADIWCTGSIDVTDGNPFLNRVIDNGFDIKLRQGFLSEENQDKLFIVPNENFLPAHQDLCEQKNANVFSVEQFREKFTEYDFKTKTVLKVCRDELHALISLVFEMGPNPYKGLEAFEENDAERFFGREDAVQELFDIYQNLSDAPMRLAAILGPSGSGKSSIARAGLVPKIRENKKDTSVIIFRPGEHPLDMLESYPVSDSASTVVIADQFEEIYSLCKDRPERSEFVNKLLDYAGSDRHRRISVIIVFRTDFLGHAQSHPDLSHALAQKTVIVPAMRPNNLRAAIAEPARRSGCVFDAKLVDELISQTEGHEGALPLLEFALSAIWQGMEKGVRPEKTLKDINGVGGALAKKAQELYDSLSNDHDKRIARRAFLSLINIGEGVFDTRRRVLLSDITAYKEDPVHVRKVLEIFSATGARLITLSADSEDRETAEITHEALFEHWNLLKKWIRVFREDILFHRRLSDAAHNWDKKGRPSGSLWQPPVLNELKDFCYRWFSDMTEIETEFYHASIYREKRDRRIRQTVLTLLLILTLIVARLTYNAQSLKEENLKLKIEIEKSNPQTVSDRKATNATKNSTNYGCDIIRDGLVAWYPFDEDSQDKSGNQNHGVAKGNLTYVSGKIGQAAKFDGVSSYITVPNHDSLNLQNMTLSAWVYDYSHPTYGPLGTSLILKKGIWSFIGDQKRQYEFSSSYGFNIGFTHFGLFNVHNRDSWEQLFSKNTIPINQWNLITVTYDGQAQKIYIDGKLKNSRDAVFNVFIPNNPAPLTIGAGFRDDNDKPLNVKNGLIDDLRIYNRALSESEVRQLYECATANNSSTSPSYRSSSSILPSKKSIGISGVPSVIYAPTASDIRIAPLVKNDLPDLDKAAKIAVTENCGAEIPPGIYPASNDEFVAVWWNLNTDKTCYARFKPDGKGSFTETYMGNWFGGATWNKTRWHVLPRLGDLNGDKIDDFVLVFHANGGVPQYKVALGKSDGSFDFNGTPVTYDSSMWSIHAMLGDMDNDGKTDFVFFNFSSGGTESTDLYMLKGQGNGTFASDKTLILQASQGGNQSLLADFNGDNNTDVFLPPDDDIDDIGQSYISLSQGDGKFAMPQQSIDFLPDKEYPSSDEFTASGTACDLNLDGHIDILSSEADIVSNSRLRRVFWGNGKGKFSETGIQFGKVIIPSYTPSIECINTNL
ncbi:MAG: hypothetical protein BWK80_58200 [Desulfobacteraceae bacterium IS3]|nr:MAG: hypothetical protein BWK80_58200 [Desulfobacteraceae bacterium IS3]